MTHNRLLDEARHLRLKKRFSQHFLVNEKILDQITAELDLQPEDTVLEIGPGGGFLTEKLLEKGCKVIAVELDREMSRYLRQKFTGRLNFELIEQDILRFDFGMVPAERFKIVGNLPYAITSKIMFLLAGELNEREYPLRKRIERLVVMVQKEVGERICALPGRKAYNPLSIALQFWFDPHYAFTVPSLDFIPPPKVESAVITLLPRTQPAADVRDLNKLYKLVQGAFSQKRKTIRNALLGAGFASGAVLDRIFEQTGVDPGLRAEALPIQAFGDLSNALGTDPGQS